MFARKVRLGVAMGAFGVCVGQLPAVVVAGDCFAAQGAKLTASDGAPFDFLGRAVALSGDVAVLGAWNDETPTVTGSAYAFIETGGVWSAGQRLVADDGAIFDRFGWSVATDGQHIVVGAPLDDSPVLDAGSAYVFVRNGSDWEFEQKLVAPDAGGDDQFGYSVSLRNGTILVGAPRDDDRGLDAGAAYAYVQVSGVWTFQSKLRAFDGNPGDQFGTAVAVDGSSALVGSPNNLGSAGGTGAAYTMVRAAGQWFPEDKLTPTGGQPGDQFGAAVALRVGRAVVGAPLSNVAAADAGAAYSFVGNGGIWTLEDTLLASDAAGSDSFGVSVALDGDFAIVGASLNDDSGSSSGSAYLFRFLEGNWREQEKILPADGGQNDFFGFSCALDGTRTLISSYLDDDRGTDAGAAYVMSVSCGLLGDMNCDGAVGVGDIAGFVLALTDPAGYASAFPNCNINNGDLNGDSAVGVSDIGLFVALLTGG